MTQEIFEAIKAIQRFQINCFSGISSLTHSQIIVLLTIGDFLNHKQISPQPSQISDYLQIAPASVTPVLNKLEDGGYLERIYSKQDRRQIFIALTDKGKTEYDSITKSIERYYQNAIDKIGMQDISQFILFAKKIQAINQEFSDGKPISHC